MSSYNDAFAKAAQVGLIPEVYLKGGFEANHQRTKIFRHLVEQRKWPEDGWSSTSIQQFISFLSAMDSNNFEHKSGVGEREGRIYSELVKQRNLGMSHGIGRSGDITEPQPKAVGSSLLYSITNALVLDFIRQIVSASTADAFVLPLATGMSITLCLQTMRKSRPTAKFVIWSRIDQKSCFKAITAAGLIPVVIDTIKTGDMLVTDVNGIRQAIVEKGPESVLCVITTTSCFAPRAVDSVENVALLCKDTSIFHLVNNAYGLQSTKCSHQIHHANRTGRLDVFVQSTDKNLMVPVGGCIVAGFSKEFISQIKKTYPGRASISPILDVLVTLLEMGVSGYRKLLAERKENFAYLLNEMAELGAKLNERVLVTPGNNISLGMTLQNIEASSRVSSKVTYLGSILYTRNVFGARVVVPGEVNEIDGIKLVGWGGHTSDISHAYLTAAATMGMSRKDVDTFIEKLKDGYDNFRKEGDAGFEDAS